MLETQEEVDSEMRSGVEGTGIGREGDGRGVKAYVVDGKQYSCEKGYK